MFALCILISIYFLYITSKSELAPQEDQGIVIAMVTGAPDATLQQTQLYTKELYKMFGSFRRGRLPLSRHQCSQQHGQNPCEEDTVKGARPPRSTQQGHRAPVSCPDLGGLPRSKFRGFPRCRPGEEQTAWKGGGPPRR